MVVVPDKIKLLLKKPLGKLYTTYEEIIRLSKNFKIISVGDVSTLALLGLGIKPHLAVFDYKVMRKNLDQATTRVFKLVFKKIRKISNPPGTISDFLLEKADKIIRQGGALFVEGEEDLTALAFIKHAGRNHIVVYGQPYEGVVVVKPDKKIKEKVRKILEQISSSKRAKKVNKKLGKKRK